MNTERKPCTCDELAECRHTIHETYLAARIKKLEGLLSQIAPLEKCTCGDQVANSDGLCLRCRIELELSWAGFKKWRKGK